MFMILTEHCKLVYGLDRSPQTCIILIQHNRRRILDLHKKLIYIFYVRHSYPFNLI